MNNTLTLKSAAMTTLLACATLAQAEVVVIINPKAAPASMTAEQVAQVFLGKSTAMKPIDLPESAPLRAEFYKKVTDKDGPQVKAIWSKLVFTGKASLPQEVPTSADVKKIVAADVNAIGYIDKAALDGSVKAVLTVP